MLTQIRDIACSQCGRKFTRKVRQQRRCDNCLPLRIRLARQAASPRRARATPGPAGIRDDIRRGTLALARRIDALTLGQFLGSACPHRRAIIDCREDWCRSRVDDLQITKTGTGFRSRRYAANPVADLSLQGRPGSLLAPPLGNHLREPKK